MVVVGDGIASGGVDCVVVVGDGVASGGVDCVVVVGDGVAMRMNMGAAGPHGWNCEGSDQQRRHRNASGVRRTPANKAGTHSSANGDGAHQGACGIGELRCLTSFQAGDP